LRRRNLVRKPQAPRGVLALIAWFSPFLAMGHLAAAGGGRGIAEPFIDKINERAAGEITAEVFADQIRGVIGPAAGLSADVRRDDYVGQVPEAAFGRQRLELGDIEGG